MSIREIVNNTGISWAQKLDTCKADAEAAYVLCHRALGAGSKNIISFYLNEVYKLTELGPSVDEMLERHGMSYTADNLHALTRDALSILETWV